MPRSRRASGASGGRFEGHRAAEGMKLRIELNDFAARGLRAEAARQGISVEDLAAYAVVYYLADLDSGRVTRKPPPVRRP